MKKKGIQKKGYVLVYVLMALILATILASSLYFAAFLANKLSIELQRIKDAYYTAISGTEYIRYIVKSGHYSPATDISKWPLGQSFDPSGGDGSVSKVTVSITSYDAGTDTYTVNSDGEYSGTHKNIVMTCTSTGSIISWQSS